MRRTKPVAGACSRCGKGAMVADMLTATRFCYIPIYWRYWKAIVLQLTVSAVVPWETYGEGKRVKHVPQLFRAKRVKHVMTNMIVTTPVNVTGAPITNTVVNHAKKSEKFNGQNFKRRQQKMFFYLTTLNLARFLNETAPQVKPPKESQPSNAQAVGKMELI
ncbi:hypothetical protein Tco_1064226 [Tanacetum coccineum]